MFMSKAYKTDLKKIKSCNNFQENKDNEFKSYLFPPQVKFYWCWCHKLKAKNFMTENSFLVGRNLDVKADLDSVHGVLSFPLCFLICHAGNEFFGAGVEMQKSKDLLGLVCHCFIFSELIK